MYILPILPIRCIYCLYIYTAFTRKVAKLKVNYFIKTTLCTSLRADSSFAIFLLGETTTLVLGWLFKWCSSPTRIDLHTSNKVIKTLWYQEKRKKSTKYNSNNSSYKMNIYCLNKIKNLLSQLQQRLITWTKEQEPKDSMICQNSRLLHGVIRRFASRLLDWLFIYHLNRVIDDCVHFWVQHRQFIRTSLMLPKTTKPSQNRGFSSKTNQQING